MAKNSMTGKVAKIYDMVAFPTKNGSTFNKREMILDCTTYDRFTGEPTPNYVLFEFSGQKCDLLNQFKKGDRVTVSFVLQGSVYKDKNTQENKVITHIIGYECVPYVSQQVVTTNENTVSVESAPKQEQQAAPVSVSSEGQQGDLPF